MVGKKFRIIRTYDKLSNFLPVSYQFLALLLVAMSFVGRTLTDFPSGPMGASGVSAGHVQDLFNSYSWEHLGRPVGDLHPLLEGLQRSLQAFMATIF